MSIPMTRLDSTHQKDTLYISSIEFLHGSLARRCCSCCSMAFDVRSNMNATHVMVRVTPLTHPRNIREREK